MKFKLELLKKRLVTFLLLIVLFYPSIGLGQIAKADSLKSELEGLDGRSKVDALNELSWILKSANAKEAKNYCEESIEISKALNYNAGTAKALYHYAIIYHIKGELNLSDSLCKLAIDYYRKDQDMVGIAKCWNVIGLSHTARGDFELARNLILKAKQVFTEIGDEAYILKLEANIGNIYFRMGHFDTALVSYNKLLDYAKKNNDPEYILTDLFNVALAQHKLGLYPKSLRSLYEVLNLAREIKDSTKIARALNSISIVYFKLLMVEESYDAAKEAVQINLKLGDEMHLSENYTNLGNVYQLMNKYDSAHYCFQENIRIRKKFGVKTKGITYGNIGRIHQRLKEWKEAKRNHLKALRLDKELGISDGVALHQFNLGTIYLIEDQLDSAEHLLLESYNYWDKLKIYPDMVSVSEMLSELYARLGNLEEDNRFKSIYKVASDSVYNLDKQRDLMRLLVQKELKEIQGDSGSADLEETSVSDKNYLPYGLVLLLLFGIGLLVLQRKRTNRVNDELKEDLQQKSRELAFLSLSAQQKDEFIQRFSDDLHELSEKEIENTGLKRLVQDLKLQNIQSNNWNHFKSAFEQIAPSFFDFLMSNYPKLTDTDLRLCAMIRLNISNQEISKILGISLSSVNKARYRLRKRFSIRGRRSLENFILSV